MKMSEIPQPIELPINISRLMLFAELKPNIANKIIIELLEYLHQKYYDSMPEILLNEKSLFKYIIKNEQLLYEPFQNFIIKYLNNESNGIVYEKLYQILSLLSEFHFVNIYKLILSEKNCLIELDLAFVFNHLTQDYPIIQANILKEFDQKIVEFLLDPKIKRIFSNYSPNRISLLYHNAYKTKFLNYFLKCFPDIFEFFQKKYDEAQKILFLLKDKIIFDFISYIFHLLWVLPLKSPEALLFPKKFQQLLDFILSKIEIYQKHLFQKYLKKFKNHEQLNEIITNFDTLYNLQNDMTINFKISFGSKYNFILDDGNYHEFYFDNTKIEFLIPRLKQTFLSLCENPFYIQVLLETNIYKTMRFSEDFFYFIFKNAQFFVSKYRSIKDILKSLKTNIDPSSLSLSWILDCIINNKYKKEIYQIFKTFLFKSEPFYDLLVSRIHLCKNKKFLLQIFELFPNKFHNRLKKKNLNYRKTRINNDFVKISNYLIQNLHLI